MPLSPPVPYDPFTPLTFERFATPAGSGNHRARRGRIHTRRGPIDTPAFMPVGTVGSVKAITPDEVEASGAQILLGNTYHLMLRPGADRMARLGGLHGFMRWPGPILTDSGGFQVYSLAGLRKLTDEAVVFRSHIDGSLHTMRPEDSVAIQRAIGSEIMMALDECPPAQAEPKVIAAAMKRTTAWAQRCMAARQNGDGALFLIVQGGVDIGLRHAHLDELAALDAPGYALGGLAVGEPPEKTVEILEAVAHRMPADKPRYLMGVGMPWDIVEAVLRGIDMFDCVIPTRNARNGQLFTFAGKVNITNVRYAEDTGPIEEGCTCPVCSGVTRSSASGIVLGRAGEGPYSRAYLRHLYMAKELLAYRLLTLHNLHFYQRLMARLRGLIEAGHLEAEAPALIESMKRNAA